MYIYCIFCETQRCTRIAEVLEACGFDRAFSPKLLRRIRKKGQNLEVVVDLLPGYVFAYSEEEAPGLAPYRWIDGIIREAGRQDERYDLAGDDRAFAEQLLAKDGYIGSLALMDTPEGPVLNDPLFSTVDGRITAVDRRKGRARVDYRFNGKSFHTWIAIEPEAHDPDANI